MTENEKTTVGTLLKSRRLELGIPLEEIVAKTRIRRTYLEAIEEDRLEQLPGEAYQKGFLSSYARQIGLKPESVLRLWQEQAAPAAVAKKAEAPPSHRPVKAAPPIRKRRKLPSALLMLPVLALVGSILWFVADRWPHEEAPVSPTISEPALPPMQTLPPAAPPSTAPAPAPPGVGEAPALPPTGNLENGGTIEKIPPALPSIPPGGGVLKLVASGPVTINLTVDNLPERRYELKAAAALSWKVGSVARITLDNPAAAQVWLGDVPVDFGAGNTIELRAASQTEQEAKP